MKTLLHFFLACCGFALHTASVADTPESIGYVPLAKDKPYIHVIHDGRAIKVQRVQDPNYALHGFFARSVRKCPPFCLQPMSPADGINLVGEIEIFEFMETDLRNGNGLLIDTRTAAWYNKGTIPGSLNIPFTEFNTASGYAKVKELLHGFGVKPRQEPDWMDTLTQYVPILSSGNKNAQWDFNQAKQLILWCNGPACNQSAEAIRGLIGMGYPAEKIAYYRGGMQMWQFWGLTTVVPNAN